MRCGTRLYEGFTTSAYSPFRAKLEGAERLPAWITEIERLTGKPIPHSKLSVRVFSGPGQLSSYREAVYRFQNRGTSGTYSVWHGATSVVCLSAQFFLRSRAFFGDFGIRLFRSGSVFDGSVYLSGTTGRGHPNS